MYYKAFFSRIVPLLKSMYDESLESGCLSPTLTQATISLILKKDKNTLVELVGGSCGSVGRAGGLVIAGSNPQLPWGGTEPHVEVSLSKILNPKIAPEVQLAPCVAATAISNGPMKSWRLIQGLRPWVKLDLAPVSPATPQGDKSGNIPHGKAEKKTNKRRIPCSSYISVVITKS